MLLIPEGEPFGELAPVLDESVIGFPSDIRPARPGVKEMLEVTSIRKTQISHAVQQPRPPSSTLERPG